MMHHRPALGPISATTGRSLPFFGGLFLFILFSPDDFHLGGLYVESLCEGLEEVLLPYKNTLMELERGILTAGNVQMTHIQHKMAPFQPVLTALNGLINQVSFILL